MKNMHPKRINIYVLYISQYIPNVQSFRAILNKLYLNVNIWNVSLRHI